MSGECAVVRPMTERQLQDAILDAARVLGWQHRYHTHDSRRSAPGFPDLVLLRPPQIVVAELKTERGRLTGDQIGWLAAFEAVPGIEVFVWRPEHWVSGDVERMLR